jgi:hypothetical protein
MFHPVIAVDSAKKAMEFLGLKDGGKVTRAEPPASASLLDAHFRVRDHPPSFA